MHSPHPASAPVDVVIAGVGPVGLVLACELRLAGVSALVPERVGDPPTPRGRTARGQPR